MIHFSSFIIGYILGNFLFALIIGKYFLHTDPTKNGSGNPGTANMGAVFGKKWGILALIGDAVKSISTLTITWLLFKSQLAMAYCGLGLMLGHCYPVTNHFKGGKGVAVIGIAILAIDFKMALIILLTALVLTIIIENLTIPPLFFTYCFGVASLPLGKTNRGLIFLVIGITMTTRFWKDIIDFAQGKGKKVDILFNIKKEIGIKIQRGLEKINIKSVDVRHHNT